MRLASVMDRLDGVAETVELRLAGMTRKQIADAVESGALLHIRRGWYALPTADPALVEAIRIGGRLACVSAAEYYGWATPAQHTLHIAVPTNASRLRLPDDEDSLHIHWIAEAEASARLVTSPRETLLQLAMCQGPDYAGAAFDSFLQSGAQRAADLEDWLGTLPDHVLRSLASRSQLCESFLESIGRIRLERLGITGVHQVQIIGVGRVDLVIDGWLVIEWDGLTHHDNARAHEEDCRRDAVLTSLGYHVLRFTYELVLHEWHIVIAAIRAALDGVTRRA